MPIKNPILRHHSGVPLVSIAAARSRARERDRGVDAGLRGRSVGGPAGSRLERRAV